MVPRLLLVVLVAAVVALAAGRVAGSAVPLAANVDFSASAGDYELLGPDADDNSSDDDAPVERFYDRANPVSTGEHAKSSSKSRKEREVRCFCNQPHCVSQGYMCRGRGCFTELPSPLTQQLLRSSDHVPGYSGCLESSFAERVCPPGKLCCEQDLCNHVDSPAMRLRLNKTLQVLLGEHRPYMGTMSLRPTGQEPVASSDSWFRTATIAVPICGFVVILILASLAIRLLQPIPLQGDKLNGLRMMPESAAPPLLGPPHAKLPLV